MEKLAKTQINFLFPKKQGIFRWTTGVDWTKWKHRCGCDFAVFVSNLRVNIERAPNKKKKKIIRSHFCGKMRVIKIVVVFLSVALYLSAHLHFYHFFTVSLGTFHRWKDLVTLLYFYGFRLFAYATQTVFFSLFTFPFVWCQFYAWWQYTKRGGRISCTCTWNKNNTHCLFSFIRQVLWLNQNMQREKRHSKFVCYCFLIFFSRK